MSFLNKIRAMGQKPGANTGLGGMPPARSVRGFAGAAPAEAAKPAATSARFNMSTQAPSGNFDSSIISEAAPSGMADFSESRLVPRETMMAPLGSGLPLIGSRPMPEQRQILVTCVVLGLLGLVGMVLWSLNSATKGSAQVGATGQALMQSQRLAKAVSQALVGSPRAFPEMRESVEVLASSVRGLKTGEGVLPAAPPVVQASLDAVMPLVDRAEKSEIGRAHV